MIDPEIDQWSESVDPFREWDSAYVLGSLSTEERRTYERHLSNCAACTNAVSDLAGIPGFLGKIDLATALELTNSPFEVGLDSSRDGAISIQELARRAIERKKFWRRRLVSAMAVAAAFLMVIGIGIGARFQNSADLSKNATDVVVAAGQVVPLHEVQPNVMTVNMQMVSKRWGTQFQWNCIYSKERTETQTPESYDLVVTDSSGAKIVVATWRELGKSAKGLVASTNIPIANVRAIDIRDTGGEKAIWHADI